MKSSTPLEKTINFILIAALVTASIMACTTPAQTNAPATPTPSAQEKIHDAALGTNRVIEFFVWLMCWEGSQVCPNNAQ